MQSAIHIGASQGAVEAYGKVIMDILLSNNDQVTKQAALESLRQGLAVNNATVSGCTVNVTQPPKIGRVR